jgi:hypothetical protein
MLNQRTKFSKVPASFTTVVTVSGWIPVSSHFWRLQANKSASRDASLLLLLTLITVCADMMTSDQIKLKNGWAVSIRYAKSKIFLFVLFTHMCTTNSDSTTPDGSLVRNCVAGIADKCIWLEIVINSFGLRDFEPTTHQEKIIANMQWTHSAI